MSTRASTALDTAEPRSDEPVEDAAAEDEDEVDEVDEVAALLDVELGALAWFWW